MMTRHHAIILTILIIVALGSLAGCALPDAQFSGEQAYRHVEALMDLGPRPTGSEANIEAGDYIRRTLEDYGWSVEEQEFPYRGETVRNIIAKKGQGPIILLGTHYDTRPLADRDAVDRSQSVPGANDGGSGTAVLLEIARVLDSRVTDEAEIWLAFFDGEDRGGIDGWDWCMGSTLMVNDMMARSVPRPEYAVIIDMIGDKDQQIHYEWSSTLWLQEKIWRIADDLGYRRYFVPQYKYEIIDDHTAFLHWGINAALVIDFDYPFWHTTEDTLDKISVDSLQRVGDVMVALLEQDPFTAGTADPSE
ncbi:MAG TPA: M28 family peptidase [Chloroflexi bacterium]|jgi:glutaminyl-peptide cyclotransferase|nr:M28 family peptidase [Chloroflexota bacterium]